MLYRDPNVIMGAQIIITVCIILGGILLSFIPADIAKKKGYNFGLFYLFSFFLFLPALIVAIVLDPKYEAMDWDPPSTQSLYQEKQVPMEKEYAVLVRNCYVNIPLRPAKIAIIEREGTLWLNMYIKNYGEEVDGFQCRLKFFNSFDRTIFEKDVSVQYLQKKAKLCYAENIQLARATELNYESLMAAEVYITHLKATDGRITEITDGHAGMFPVPLRQLSQLKNQYGSDAMSYPRQEEDGWICRCGVFCKNAEKCPVCGREMSSQSAEENDYLGVERQLQTEENLSALKTILIEAEDILQPEVYQDCLNYVNNLISIDSMYHGDGKIADKEKQRLLALLRQL